MTISQYSARWGVSLALLLSSCATIAPEGWVPVRSGPAMPPVDVNEVLVIDAAPATDHVKVGYAEPPTDKIIRVSFGDTELLSYFKSEAAKMGANTVVLRNSPIKYKSGRNEGTRVDFLFVKDETGTHGGDEMDFDDGALRIDEEMMRLY